MVSASSCFRREEEGFEPRARGFGFRSASNPRVFNPGNEAEGVARDTKFRGSLGPVVSAVVVRFVDGVDVIATSLLRRRRFEKGVNPTAGGFQARVVSCSTASTRLPIW